MVLYAESILKESSFKITVEEMEGILHCKKLLTDKEMLWIMEKASTVESWTDVGVYLGGSALCAGIVLPSGGLLQLVEKVIPFNFYSQLNWLLKCRPNLRVIIAAASSEEAAKVLADTEGVFIDDDHTYEGVSTSIRA